MVAAEAAAAGSSQLPGLGQSAMNQSVMSLRETDAEGKIQTLQAVSRSPEFVYMCVCVCMCVCVKNAV